MASRSSGNDTVLQERRYIAYYYKLYAKYSRALEWHSRGRRFDPDYLHQERTIRTLLFQKAVFG